MSDEASRLPVLELVSATEETNSSCFHKLEISEHLSLLPCFVGRLSQGVTEHLNKKLLRYSDHYGGVLLAYSKPCVQQTYGRILDEQPHIHFDLKYTAYVFRPVIGSVVCGTVNNVGGDHVGCLVHDCFNASVFSNVGGGGEGKTKKRLNGLFASKFNVGSKIWFRVVSIENVSGILSIIGEYFDVELSNLSREERDGGYDDITLPLDSSISSVDVGLDADVEGGQTGLTSPEKRKTKDKKVKKKKKKKREKDYADSVTEDSQNEVEDVEPVKLSNKLKLKKKKVKSKYLEEEPSECVHEAPKIGKKRKISIEHYESPKKKKKKSKEMDKSAELITLTPKKHHKHKR